MGHIISVLNHKGGVGKTTLAVNLAHALTKHEKRVLVIDNDTQCNATNIILPKNADIASTLYDIYNPDQENKSPKNYIYPTKYKNLWCVPNDTETGSLEAKFFRSEEYPKNLLILKDVFKEHLSDNFDFTIIDNPPSLAAFVITALNLSNLVIIPSRAGSGFSIEGVINAVDLIVELGKELNPDLKLLRLLINQVDRRTSSGRYTIERLRQHFGDDYLFNTTIPTNATFEGAELAKETILKFKGACPGARAFRELAEETLSLFNGTKVKGIDELQ